MRKMSGFSSMNLPEVARQEKKAEEHEQDQKRRILSTFGLSKLNREKDIMGLLKKETLAGETKEI